MFAKSRHRCLAGALAAAALFAAAAVPPAAAATSAQTTLVSADPHGNPAFGNSGAPSASLFGRFVAFASTAQNVVPDDNNGVQDVFVRDTKTAVMTRVSVPSTGDQAELGTEANAASYNPTIQLGGRYVVFESDADNLIPGDDNHNRDVFRHDLKTGQTILVSQSQYHPAYGGNSFGTSVSWDGRYVAFSSSAWSLAYTEGYFNLGQSEIYVRDIAFGTTTRVTLRPDGVPADDDSYNVQISIDGKYVAFETWASNLVDGQDDANMWGDIVRTDLRTGETVYVNVTNGGDQGNHWAMGPPAISANGQYVAFMSWANLVGSGWDPFHIYVRDMSAATTTRVSAPLGSGPGDGEGSIRPSISGDGRYVAYTSWSKDLVPKDVNGHADIFVWDRTTEQNRKVSTGMWPWPQANGDSDEASISFEGAHVAFESDATNLIPNDYNGRRDVFTYGPRF